MRKLLAIVLLLPLNVIAANAIKYIDPTCGAAGNGTSSDCGAGSNAPLAAWPAGSTFLAATNYYQKAGTTITQCSVVINTTGTSGDPIVLGAYGTGSKPITQCTTTNGYVFWMKNSYVTIAGLEIKSSSSGGTCIWAEPGTNTTTGQVISGNLFNTCYSNAINYDASSSSTRDIDSVTVVSNESTGSGSFVNIFTHASNTNTFTDWNITSNNVHDCRVGYNGNIIKHQWAETQTTVFDGWNIDNNVFTNCKPGGTTTNVFMVALKATVTTNSYSAKKNRITNFSASGNTITTTNGGIWLEHATGVAQSDIQINNNAMSGLLTRAGIALFYTKTAEIKGNTFDGITPFSGDIDGIALDIDYYNEDIVIDGNTVKNIYGDAATTNSGMGIYMSYSKSPMIIKNNLLVNAKHGIWAEYSLDTTGVAQAGTHDPKAIYNNTVINSAKNGMYIGVNERATDHIYNNIIYGHSGSACGIYRRTNNSVAPDTRNNIVFGSNNYNYAVGDSGNYLCDGLTATSTNGTEWPYDINSDPLISSSTGAQSSSLSLSIDGSYSVGGIGGRSLAMGSVPFYGTPDIGAIEYQPPYTIGTNALTAPSARIYQGDQEGRFRILATSTGTCPLQITPSGGSWNDLSSTDVRPAFGDVTNLSCPSKKKVSFTFTPASSMSNPVFRYRGARGQTYQIKVGGALAGSSITGCQKSNCLADKNGDFSFAWNGSLATAKTFEIVTGGTFQRNISHRIDMHPNE